MERKIISVCKRDRNSTWSNGEPRRTTKGMTMVVDHEILKGGKIKSTTRYI